MFDEMGELLARLYDLDRETHDAITNRFCCVESSIPDKYDDIYEKIVQGCIQDACVRKEWDFRIECETIFRLNNPPDTKYLATIYVDQCIRDRCTKGRSAALASLEVYIVVLENEQRRRNK